MDGWMAPRTLILGGHATYSESLARPQDMDVFVIGESMVDEAFTAALHTALRSLIDRLGSVSFNAGIWNLDSDVAPLWDPCPQAGDRPVVARVLSRGRLSSAASDYGGFEVMGGGSIGHTDPFLVAAAIDQQLAAAAGEHGWTVDRLTT